VTPPNVLLNIQGSVTRTTNSGTIHGANQKITLDQALRAVTINGARQLAIDDKVGSLEVGKQADLVELSMDPMPPPPSSRHAGVGPRHWVGAGASTSKPSKQRCGHGPSTAPGAGEAQSAPPVVDEDGSGRQWARGHGDGERRNDAAVSKLVGRPILGVLGAIQGAAPNIASTALVGASRGLHMAGGTLALASSVARSRRRQR